MWRSKGYVGSPIQNNVTLTAQSMVEPIPGVYVYDMGQNMVGVPRLTFKGKAGQEITIRFGEMNYPETIPTEPVAPYTIAMYKEKKGQVYTDNYRSALSTDRYILKGDAAGETYEPRFTFHGFRYVEIHGLERPLPLEAVKGIVLESIGARTSGYETSDERVNRLFNNIIWGQRGNFLSVPTDCPQRDERMGWTGDAQVFARTATYNMNVDPFYTRWLYSVRDNQGDDGSYAKLYTRGRFPSTRRGGWRRCHGMDGSRRDRTVANVSTIRRRAYSGATLRFHGRLYGLFGASCRTLCTALRWFRRLAGYRADEFHVDEHRLLRLRRLDYGAGSETFREGRGPKGVSVLSTRT